MGNTPMSTLKNTPVFIFERILSDTITIGISNNEKQGLRFNNIMYYYKNLIEQENKLIYQFENQETDQVFLTISKFEDKITYILEIDNKKYIGNINNTIRKIIKTIDFHSKEIDKIFEFIK